ncbi:MAG: bifunctional diguanylate cyclase/phosphodiesterase [Pseudomonadales bacterium]|nr:bifunctional diguanylate cyclase/phosphodiesterase [Pseudomonadales bacterium]
MANFNQSRQQFLEHLSQACEVNSDDPATLGLLVFDLLQFHRVNAVFGYEIGDQVLRSVMARVEKAGFKNSELARIGSDEFALLLRDVKDPKLLTLAANKLVRELSEPFEFEQRILRIEPVIGIAAKLGEEWDAEQLLIAAEKNLLEAQQQNKRFLTYSLDTKKQGYDWRFESALHKALSLNELNLFYQPKIHVATGAPTHAEALSRWIDSEYGTVGPNDFIPILEQSGAIDDLTKWGIHTAMREMASWPLRTDDRPYSVAVNVSTGVLENPEFPEIIKSALSIWGTNPENLTLEITEGALVQEEQSSYQSLYRLKDLGLKISIDDFGTGYSCLSYFKRIPADELKVDQSFVKNMRNDLDDEHLTRVIIDLAHRFNMDVVAEGVEDKETYLKLREFGCDYIQGFYFTKPLSQEKYCDWLANFDATKFD